MTTYTATYSPDDNKLRLYTSSRLDAETYARVKAAGFKWAPKQDLFVAPMWTPGREDLLLELAGEIGDEDTSLTERAEERAERFDEYSEKRANDAESARKAVAAIADNIPLGQPILIGHHSERHARKDAERIQNGMRRAVKAWETSQYWTQRAAGAIAHAKYKERPDVRARRIKGLEADLRKVQKGKQTNLADIRMWETLHDDAQTVLKRKDGTAGTFYTRALFLANTGYFSHSYPLDKYPRTRPEQSTYEGPIGLWSALGGDKGEDAAIITPEQAQRMVLNGARASIERLDRWIAHYENRLAYERAMLAEDGGTVSDRKPLEIGGAVQCAPWSPRGGWSYIVKVNRVTVTVRHTWSNGGRTFRHNEPITDLQGIMSRAEVEAARADGRLQEVSDGIGFMLLDEAPKPAPQPEAKPEAAQSFEAMRETLRAGVQIVSAPQLFPTPRELAKKVADLADVRPGHRVLEPSAGTGALLGAIGGRMFAHNPEAGAVAAVEIVPALAERLRREFPLTDVRCSDFLALNGELGTFDRILMNPPFENASDIKHIKHAAAKLNPGGRLVAICANGPRQREALQPLASHWEELPEGTFKQAGTNVNTALLVIDN